MSDTPQVPTADGTLPPLGILIGGRWLAGDEPFPVSDKFTGATICEVASASKMQVSDAVARAQSAFLKGPLQPYERSRVLDRLGGLLASHRERFRALMVAEAGFTLADADGEIDRAIITVRLCAEEATRIVGDTVPFGSQPGAGGRLGFTIRVPLGVVCAITPFNSPLNTVLHKIAPAFAAGNPVVLKPSNLTPLTSALLCELFLEAGVPPDALALVHGAGATVGSWLVEDQTVAFYTFTGSTRVGAQIQQGAGLRRTQMELGSIASTIVCADADLDKALPKIANAAFRKAGQVCTSVQRLYVHEAIIDEVNSRLAHLAGSMRAGNPRDPDTRVGPMIAVAEAERALSWIEQARLGQARILQGGTRDRAVLQPTVITAAQPGMRVLEQEIFAPCVTTLPFRDLNAAVADANATPFGLAAGIFTADITNAFAAARTLRFGAIHINETSSARADAMPFGGVKASGFGHEGPRYAIRELTEERLITVN
ncbi:Aldehyde dehydrogenase [Hyphomicrobiales bacterium]|nr:Aldehyde dehydrogenase [Hyphomicrobiales bacterium]CAH1693228.1 Aldehyde dehydrogenase [Hyphomicrobiales bacterium]